MEKKKSERTWALTTLTALGILLYGFISVLSSRISFNFNCLYVLMLVFIIEVIGGELK